MSKVIRKTIMIPTDLKDEIEKLSKKENRSFNSIVNEALKLLIKKNKLKSEFFEIQNYWNKIAKRKKIFTEEELEKILKE